MVSGMKLVMVAREVARETENKTAAGLQVLPDVLGQIEPVL
jgi:hypothetical protein